MVVVEGKEIAKRIGGSLSWREAMWDSESLKRGNTRCQDPMVEEAEWGEEGKGCD